jgi:small conductance mechanosensitive channel
MSPILALPLLIVGQWWPSTQEKLTPKAPAQPASSWETLTTAERIARIERAADKDQKRLKELQARLDDPNCEYAQAQAEFRTLDDQRTALQQKLQALKNAGNPEEMAKLREAGKALDADWQDARDRFDLAIQERQILQQEIAALQKRIQQRQQDLARVTAPEQAEPRNTAAVPPKTPAGTTPATPAKAAVTPAPAKKTDPDPPSATTAAVTSRPPSKHLVQAQEEARAREAAAEEARAKVQLISERLEAVRKSIELEHKLSETARKRADKAQEEHTALTRDLAKKQADKAGDDELRKLTQKMAEAEQRMTRARSELAASTDRLQDLQASQTAIEAALAGAQKAAEQRQAEADAAQRRVAQLEDPFSLPNLMRWAREHGPRVALILVGMLALSRLGSMTGRRIVKFMAQHGHRGTPEENESRAQTLVGVFRNAASLAVLCGGLLMILDEIGIPIMPLLGGAAVVGLAVAFGAQNLIRDYFSGFMVLMEDQYGINDVVRIGTVSGTVEKITLRMTVLRDMGGVVHFIPHGTITTVSNLTHGWSRALFDVNVAAGEDVDRVMNVLLEVGQGLRQDPAYAAVVLEAPEMLGVDDLGDGKVVVRFFLKTRPLKQWAVKREMLRRIKLRFDELRIESPFSHHSEPAQAKAA